MFLLLLVAIIALTILGAFALFLRKMVLQRRLEAGLGREVEKRELTDIGAWMKATPGVGESRVIPPAQALKRKHGDVIALTLGVIGLLALALSIVISRFSHSTTFYAVAFFVSIAFVIIGLPLGLKALSRAKRFPGTYGSNRLAVIGTLSTVALALCLLVLTLGDLFGGRAFHSLFRPDLYSNPPSYQASSPGTTAKTAPPLKKRKDLLPAIDSWFKTKNQPNASALAVGNKEDQLRINVPHLKKPAADSLAKQFISEKGNELTTAGFANSFKLTDLGQVIGIYEFKSVDQLARETMLPIAELWFAAKKINAAASFDKADDTKLVIDSSSLNSKNELALSIQFIADNGRQMKGFGFKRDFTLTNGSDSWVHQLY